MKLYGSTNSMKMNSTKINLMKRHRRFATIVAVVALLVGVSACAASSTSSQQSASSSATTLSNVTWVSGGYGPSSMDPVKYNDYPEDQIIPDMCESLFRQVPGMSTVPNLAKSYKWTTPTTLVLQLQSGVHFWDGTPMTSADVVYSLERNLNPQDESIYVSYFRDVTSIQATGPLTVTVHLSQPDYLFVDDLAQLGGAVIEKAYAEREGAKFGTPAGGIMCTGPYIYQSWNGTTDLVMTRNPHYWDKAIQAKVQKITWVWPTDDSTVVTGLETGSLDGLFNVALSDAAELKQASSGTLTIGPESQAMEVYAMIVVGTQGAIANPLVREALSMSIDREGIVKAAEGGIGEPAYSDSAPGYDTYDQAAYNAAYAKLSANGYNPTEAAKLVKEAGSVAKEPIVFAIPGSSTEVADIGAIIQQNADAVGLNFQLKVVPAEQYGALFSDASARKGYDLIFTGNYDNDPDPTAIYDDIALPNGLSNFNSYDNSTVVKLLNEATGTPNLTTRAQLTIEAQSMIMKDLPWIPLNFTPNVFFVAKDICGTPMDFSIMASLWEASLHAC